MIERAAHYAAILVFFMMLVEFWPKVSRVWRGGKAKVRRCVDRFWRAVDRTPIEASGVEGLSYIRYRGLLISEKREVVNGKRRYLYAVQNARCQLDDSRLRRLKKRIDAEIGEAMTQATCGDR